MKRELSVLLIAALTLFGVLVIRLFYINSKSGTEYKKIVLSQQEYTSTDIPYKRGTITDTNGTVLAESELVYNVILDAYQMNGKDEDAGTKDRDYITPTANALATIGIDKQDVIDYVTENTTSRYYIIKKYLPYSYKTMFELMQTDTEEAIRQLQEKIETESAKSADEQNTEDLTTWKSMLSLAQSESFDPDMIRGVWFEAGYIRNYTNGSMACDLLGFANTSNVGTGGVEEYYNDILNGTPGRQYGYVNDDSNLERTTINAQDGNNLVLTIDANIQSIIEKYLEEFNDEYANTYHEGYGARNVGCIIQNVNTGEILGMASYPKFDLNDPYNTDPIVGMPVLDKENNDEPTDEIMTQEDVDSLSEEDQSRYLNALWKNYCISDYYEPGSVAKPFTTAAGLESGKLKGDETYYCTGSLEVGGWTIKCHSYSYGGDGAVDLSSAIERSCNVALMQEALTIGVDDFCRFQRIFNFGLKTNIDLSDEARTDDFLISADEMSVSDLATNSFGQNFDVTMIQMITGFSSLINGGYYYEPHVVRKITTSTGATVKEIQPRVIKRTVSESTSEKIREYTKQVVAGENGTGHTARPAGYMIGGKTGTAETLPRGNNEYVVSFMGYAPADDPQIAIYVVVDRCNNAIQDDAKYATRIVRKILTEVLPYLGIYMTEPLTAEEEEELEALQLDNTLAYSAGNLDKLKQSEMLNKDCNLDLNGDGVMDAYDSDDDGLPDALDSDGDGKSDVLDSDHDGIADEDTSDSASSDSSDTSESDTAGTSDASGTSSSAESEPAWSSWEIDPDTGYRINPDTGALYDPDTGTEFGSSSLPADDTSSAGSSSASGDSASADGASSSASGSDTAASASEGAASSQSSQTAENTDAAQQEAAAAQ